MHVVDELGHPSPQVVVTADRGMVHQRVQCFCLLPVSTLAVDLALWGYRGDDARFSSRQAVCNGVREQTSGDASIVRIESGFCCGAEEICPFELVTDVDASATRFV